jgi:hypothetical protein
MTSSFTCPECGSHEWGTSNCTRPVSEWEGHCHGCGFTWHRQTEDSKVFAIPVEKNSISETLLEIACKHGNAAVVDIVSAYASRLTSDGVAELLEGIRLATHPAPAPILPGIDTKFSVNRS